MNVHARTIRSNVPLMEAAVRSPHAEVKAVRTPPHTPRCLASVFNESHGIHGVWMSTDRLSCRLHLRLQIGVHVRCIVATLARIVMRSAVGEYFDVNPIRRSTVLENVVSPLFLVFSTIRPALSFVPS